MFTCKNWIWKPYEISKELYDNLFDFLTTIKKEYIKDIKVTQLYIKEEKIDCICCQWIIENNYDITFYFDEEKFLSLAR